jgi:hypothetical protein
MMMVVRRFLAGVAAVGALLLGTSTPAFGGGAVWKFDRDQYAPGEVATAVTGIGWEHNPELGTPADGPYLAYLFRADADDFVGTKPWPNPPDNAVLVGEVEIGDGPVEEAPGFLVGPHHARLQFTVPSLPAGNYQVQVCNNPCTKTLADIIGGHLAIARESPVVPSPVVEPSATATDKAPSDSRDISVPLTLGVVAALGTGVVATWRFTRQRRLAPVRSRSA